MQEDEERKSDVTLEDVFLDKDNTHKISLLEKMLNEETFYWNNVPKDKLFKYTDVEFASYVLDGKYVGQLFRSYKIDKKVFMFCHLYHWICARTNTAKEFMRVVELFYDIKYSTHKIEKCDLRRVVVIDYDEEYELLNGLKIVEYIKNKADAPIIKDLENEPSLQNVMKYYNQNDIGKALEELRKITEFSDKKNEKFKNFILSQGEDLREMCKKVYKFITTYENHLAENAGASDTEAQIWFDLGLSIYRLYLRQ